MASPATLLKVLQHFNCPVQPKNADALTHLFENPTGLTNELLDWLCIEASNSIPLPALTDNSKHLETSNAKVKKRLQKLRAQQTEMTAEVNEMRQRLQNLAHLGLADQSSGDEAKVEVRNANWRLAQATLTATTAAKNVAAAHQADRECGDSGPQFISQCSQGVEAWLEQEDVYTDAILQYTQQQDRNGSLAARENNTSDNNDDDDRSTYQWISLDDPTSFIVHGHSIEEYTTNTLELQRLKGLDELTNLQAMEAIVSKSQVEAGVKFCEQALSAVHTHAHETVDHIRARLTTLRQKRDATLVQFQLTKEKFRRSAADAAQMQHSCILHGDYDLKIARQNYVTQRQDSLIEFLLDQRARQEFMSVMLELEQEDHLEGQRLIEALIKYLQHTLSDHERRMHAMKTANSTQQNNRKTIPSTDKTFSRLYSVLQPVGSESCGLVTYDLVHMELEQLINTSRDQNAKYEQARNNQSQQHSLLETNIQSCLQLISSDGQRGHEEPTLVPSIVDSNVRLLEGNLESLTRAIKVIDSQIKQHKAALATDPQKRRQAQIMELFFTRPQSL
eukprot:m.143595 g.143595  ORF g.143595 m.143595 type:complete len:562 (-) comp30325_c0_seq2:117-1802(-)